MSVEQTGIVDFVSIDRETNHVWLTISDHLPWDVDQGKHLELLQEKLNAYLRFIESGELAKKYPRSTGKDIVINLVAKFPPSDQGKLFIEKARAAIGWQALD